MHPRLVHPTLVWLGLAVGACSGAQNSGPGACARDGTDLPGSKVVRQGSDKAGVDRASARGISDAIATEELRRLETRHRAERPDMSLALLDFDVQPSEPSPSGGCVVYGFFYAYRQPAGRELGPGESHFNVFVAENGKAWILWGH